MGAKLSIKPVGIMVVVLGVRKIGDTENTNLKKLLILKRRNGKVSAKYDGNGMA